MLSGLSEHLHSLEFHGTHIAQVGMTSLAVVKHLNVVNDVSSGLFPGLIGGEKHPLRFEAAEKAFGNCVVPAVTFPTHTADHTVCLEQLLKIIAAADPVRVEHEPGVRTTAPDAHPQSIDNQLLGYAFVH